jgi:EAL domain-containing protein (putative c-di-GMP-specific phosphodiesterase class I)/DNA-binding response OmpR family regulator
MAAEKILAVDDDDDILLIIETLLRSANYSVLTAHDGKEAIALALEARPDLVLLDVMMPELSGWEVCTTLKSAPETRDTPVVMLTVKSEIRDLITGMQVGADDYITKPFTKRRLLATVQQQLLARAERAAGYRGPDTTEFRYKHLLFDAISGLPTVPVVIDALRDRLLENRELGLLYADVAKFAPIEEFYGWEVFDDLLREVSRTLQGLQGTLFAENDFIAINRPGGADFHVFTSVEAGSDASGQVRERARKMEEALRRALEQKFSSRLQQPIQLIVGHALIRPNPQMRVERVVYRAMREAIRAATAREADYERELAPAFRALVERSGLRTVYQPIFDLATLEVVGHEALTKGPPNSPFESAEALFEYAQANGLVQDLEKRCLEWSASRYRGRDGHILFVNVEAETVATFRERGLAVLGPLAKLGRRIVIELTERAAIRDVPQFREAIHLLRQNGFRFAIDDAGSGYASLEAIAELRPNFLKVANTLVTGLANDTIKHDVVEMLVTLARRIEAICVAEGIESSEDLEECRRLGIAYGQGFYLGRPTESGSGG